MNLNLYLYPHDYNLCPASPETGGLHEPEWCSLSIRADGGQYYIDVNCKHCGRSGCVGTQESLAKDISW